MQFAKSALTTAAAAAFATTYGLAPALAGPAAPSTPAPKVETAGVSQTAELGQPQIFGLPAIIPGVIVVGGVFGLAVAASNEDNTNSTTGTR